jgi:type II secretion system protein C
MEKVYSDKKGGKLDIHKVFLIIKLALVLLLLFIIARAIVIPLHLGKILGPDSAIGIESRIAQEPSTLESTLTKDYILISERNIFGLGDQNAKQQTSLRSSSTETTQPIDKELGLILLGTISGSPEVSRAVIKNTQNNETGLHKQGDLVATASIEKIEKDSVILLHEGKRKILTLGTTQSNDNSISPSMSQQAFEEKNEKSNSNSDANTIPKEVNTKINNIDDILERAVITPYSVKGKVEGLKLTGIENIPMANVFGLKNGDIIQVINGQHVNSKQKVFQIFKKARTQPAMNIELLRDGQTKQLTFQLR